MKFFKKRLFISISIQIAVFLVLIAFLPVAVTMALKTYEKQLLELTEHSNVQQARLVSSSLSQNPLTKESADSLLKAMNGEFESRIRIIGKEGNLLADSATTTNKENAGTAAKVQDFSSRTDYSSVEKVIKSAEQSFIYRLFSIPIRIYRKFRKPSANPFSTDYYTSRSTYDGNEIKSALQGNYGSITRFSRSGNSVTLYSAIPVFKQDSDEVQGAVLVSCSTYKILQNLYELRLDLGKIFLASLIFVLFVSLFFTFRISLPLQKLSKQTQQTLDKHGRILTTSFTGKNRHDEIGILSRSFTALLEKLNKRLTFTQSFASDVSHEFKNPLAAIRSCTEVLETPNLTEEERKEFTHAITEEVTHLQKLLTEVRNITKIDAGTEENTESEPVPLKSALKNIISRISKVYPEKKFNFEAEDEDIFYKIPEFYFDRLAENLIENAASFAISCVKISLKKENGKITLTVEDDGKGIAEEEKSKIFDRFYSHRNENEKSAHTGLGLATVKAIADSVKAEISVAESEDLGGAKFSIKLQENYG
ncbi:ATP-binding protein [Treponema sp.]|uniref:sensor histidine kinase n=1 Tax=Treponema sp. TaxID=166 RepID=UPI003890BE53